MNIPSPVRLYRIIHIDNLHVLLHRNALHAPNHAPDDGLAYRTIHDANIQNVRHNQSVPVGLGGSVHDYLPFYLGPLSPMLYRLSKGGVSGYTQGQAPLIYLVAWANEMEEAGYPFVFSDGHGVAAFTHWYDDLKNLGQLDWQTITARNWADTPEDNDRKRRKQAEFLIHRSLPWTMVKGIAVINAEIAAQVNRILDQHPDRHRPPIRVISDWYF